MCEIRRIYDTEIGLESAIKALIERIDKLKKEPDSKRSQVFYLMSIEPYIIPKHSAVWRHAIS